MKTSISLDDIKSPKEILASMLPVAERTSPCEVKEKCFLFFPSERQCDLGRRADWDIRQTCLLITILSLLNGNPMVLDVECLLLWVYSGILWVYNLNSENKIKTKTNRKSQMGEKP